MQIENLLFVTIDTLRADHVGALGNFRETTPNIDHLASRGTTFTQAIAHAPWTRPSMAALVTGLLPTTVGLTCHNFRMPKAECDVLPASAVTLAETLHDAGFRTASIVANINVDRVFGFAQGYAHFELVADALSAKDPNWRSGDSWMQFTTEAVTKSALAWLAARSPNDGRFFLNLHYLDPHEPYDPPEIHRQAFSADHYANIDAKSRGEIALYDGEIRFVDEQIQRVIEELERSGLSKTTGIIITSDHGEEFREHGGIRHGFSLFDEQLRVPLIMILPGLTDDVRRVDEQVRLIDVMPTVLDALRVPPPPSLAGQSLLPARIFGRAPEVPPTLSEWGYTPLVSWRDPPWKLIHNTKQRRSLLFDILQDPREREDVASRHPQVIEKMLTELETARDDARKLGERLIQRDSGEVGLDEEQKERLRSLGYIDSE